MRLADADRELTKYNYNPDEPRDWHGRWTSEGATNQTSLLVPRAVSDPTVDESSRAVDIAARDDIMRSIVKNACIAECSESKSSHLRLRLEVRQVRRRLYE